MGDRRSNNTNIPPEQRAEALTSLAAKKNTCANDITDTEKTKKTITKDGKQAFQFVKPQKPEDYQNFKRCIDEGTKLDRSGYRNSRRMRSRMPRISTLKSLTDAQLLKTQDLLKVFESARSYKTSLLIQAMRLAEMEGRTADRDRLKAEADAARQSFIELSDVGKKIQAEIDDRTAAKEDAANREKVNTNAAANKK